MKVSKYEYSMELLVAMTATVLAKRQRVSCLEAFDTFIQSETANMIFDEDTHLWWNGPDYLADEFERETKALQVCLCVLEN